MPKINRSRARLLAELEKIVGSNCYNGSIQNWGPNGAFYGEGREFRYPLTVVNSEGAKEKIRGSASSLEPANLITGYYAFGANQLQIIMALDEVVRHLEEKYDLRIS